MTSPVHVTDHALIRYMQRVLDIDIEQLRTIIADACARHQGAPCVKVLGARFMLVDGRVVTATNDGVLPSHEALKSLIRASED